MGNNPWGRWYAVLKVVVLSPIFIIAITAIVIIALFDPQKFSAGAGIFHLEYEAKPVGVSSPMSHERPQVKMEVADEHPSVDGAVQASQSPEAVSGE